MTPTSPLSAADHLAVAVGSANLGRRCLPIAPSIRGRPSMTQCLVLRPEEALSPWWIGDIGHVGDVGGPMTARATPESSSLWLRA
jgi:hypothetical protein